MKIVTILGTRPEIVKLSTLIPLLDKEFEHILIHTGQHYDYEMDSIFFEQLNLRGPDYLLNVGSHTPGKQTALMLIKIEEILLKEKPQIVLVFADPNTPLAGALAASKLSIPLVHLEAGCRSFNKRMPEEINRIICDHCADFLLAPDEIAKKNLLREGLPPDKIYVVGSTAIESSIRNVILAREKYNILSSLNLNKEKFVLATLHRAENTDNPVILQQLLDAIGQINALIPVIFPLHPRTKERIKQYNLNLDNSIKVIGPQGYFDLLQLLDNCLLVMSDSGGIQEEAAALNVPCVILRNETEWTYLIDAGKNILVGTASKQIVSTVRLLLNNPAKIVAMKRVQLHLNINVSEKIIEVLKHVSPK